MKIIKHGDTHKNKVCNNCNCEFGYTDNDIQNFYSEGFLGFEGFVNYYIRCPECGHKIIIDVDEDNL